MVMETLTIQKPRAYLLLTKFFPLKINKIENTKTQQSLVFTYLYLQNYIHSCGLPIACGRKQTNKKNLPKKV